MIIITKKIKDGFFSSQITLDNGAVIICQGSNRGKTRKDVLEIAQRCSEKNKPANGAGRRV